MTSMSTGASHLKVIQRLGQQPRVLLGSAVAFGLAAVGLQVLLVYAGAVLLAFAAPLLLFCLGLVPHSLEMAARHDRRPEAFVAEPAEPAFRTLPNREHLYDAVSDVPLNAGQIALWLAMWPVAVDAFALPLVRVFVGIVAAVTVLSGVITGVKVAAVWRDAIGVRLRPDGLLDRRVFGSLSIPWEALAPGYQAPRSPSARALRLAYARPSLVRRRGLIISRTRISATDVDARFLGRVIAHYVAYPQARTAIGSPAEHDRLRHTLASDCPPEPQP